MDKTCVQISEGMLLERCLLAIWLSIYLLCLPHIISSCESTPHGNISPISEYSSQSLGFLESVETQRTLIATTSDFRQMHSNPYSWKKQRCSSCFENMGYGGLNENFFHRLGYLNTQVPVGGIVWKGLGGAVIGGGSMSLVAGFEIKSLMLLLVCSLLCTRD